MSTDLKAISATPGAAAGAATTVESLAKLIDTTTCIGCKACEVACQEWNDQEFSVTEFDGTYQTLTDLDHNFWNLIKFNEFEREDGELTWNIARRRGPPGRLSPRHSVWP